MFSVTIDETNTHLILTSPKLEVKVLITNSSDVVEKYVDYLPLLSDDDPLDDEVFSKYIAEYEDKKELSRFRIHQFDEKGNYIGLPIIGKRTWKPYDELVEVDGEIGNRKLINGVLSEVSFVNSKTGEFAEENMISPDDIFFAPKFDHDEDRDGPLEFYRYDFENNKPYLDIEVLRKYKMRKMKKRANEDISKAEDDIPFSAKYMLNLDAYDLMPETKEHLGKVAKRYKSEIVDIMDKFSQRIKLIKSTEDVDELQNIRW